MDLQEIIAQYAPVELRPDLTGFSMEEQLMVRELMGVKPALDSVFMQLNTRHGRAILNLFQNLVGFADGELETQMDDYMTYLQLNKGNRDFFTTKKFVPEFSHDDFLRLARKYSDVYGSAMLPSIMALEDAIFTPGHVETGMYPEEVTLEILTAKQEITGRPFDAKFSVVVERGGEWVEVPYHEHFSSEFGHANMKLQKAAHLAAKAGDTQLANKLSMLGIAFVTGDFTEYWEYTINRFDPMESRFNVHFNFEEYLDKLISTDGKNPWEDRNLKGGPNLVVCMLDRESTELYNEPTRFLNDIEVNLPFEPARRTEVDQEGSPSAYYRTLMQCGGSDSGPQTLAWIIPNLPYETIGRERIGFSDAMEGKNSAILEPIAAAILDPEIFERYPPELRAKFLAYFSMRHEESHGLGSKHADYENLLNHGNIEEAKADNGGLNITKFMAEDIHPGDDKYVMMLRCMADLMIAGQVRQMRFGIGSEHARSANITQNHLIDTGAVQIRDGRLYGDTDRIIEEVTGNLYPTLLKIAATADESLLAKLRPTMKIRPEVREIIETRLTGIPRDIHLDITPQYSVGTE